MDRESLSYLLSSGKFLCYNPAGLDGRFEMNEPDKSLFDSPYLANAVFFKEAHADDNDTVTISTRVLMVFNEKNVNEGGASVLAQPDALQESLKKWFGGKVPIAFSDHDRNILDVFCRTPTFDPFLLLSQRKDIEQARPVDPACFTVDTGTAEAVREIITIRASKLVELALQETDSAARLTATVQALEEAIWRCEANTRTGDLFRSLGVRHDQINRILFAWKGIAYYEYLFRSFAVDYQAFLAWLRSDESLPNDMKTIPSDRTVRLRGQRRVAQGIMRGYYQHATEILKKHSNAYRALIDQGNPEPFQKFLIAAPTLFETLGLSIGTFGHTSNAWKALTNQGRRPARNADALEGFYRFISDLATSKLDP